MAIEVMRFRAMDEAKKSSAKRLETRRATFDSAGKRLTAGERVNFEAGPKGPRRNQPRGTR
jgi:hypothetical protein